MVFAVIQEAIRNAIELMGPNTTAFLLTASDVDELLSITLSNTYFSFKSSIYLQHQGLPMGSSLSGYLAILFVNKIEKAALTQYQPLNTYKRYADDTFFQTKDEEHANAFHLLMNQQHPSTQFEIEKPTTTAEGLSLSLLDFTVTLTNEGSTTFFYKKKAKKLCLLISTQCYQEELKLTY